MKLMNAQPPKICSNMPGRPMRKSCTAAWNEPARAHSPNVPGRLVEEYDGCQQCERRTAEACGGIACGAGQQHRFEYDRGQCRRGGHPEEQCVGYGRRKGAVSSPARQPYL